MKENRKITTVLVGACCDSPFIIYRSPPFSRSVQNYTQEKSQPLLPNTGFLKTVRAENATKK